MSKKTFINLNTVTRFAKLNALGHQFCGAQFPDPLIHTNSNVFEDVGFLHSLSNPVLSDPPVHQNQPLL